MMTNSGLSCLKIRIVKTQCLIRLDYRPQRRIFSYQTADPGFPTFGSSIFHHISSIAPSFLMLTNLLPAIFFLSIINHLYLNFIPKTSLNEP
ncbi:hypothetical protein SAMN05421827_11727 [Pedobacter terrae]|uniref:Uncharacterized protein n=1 Tax=Pedobacter terrae TaxID=405671 RepID=A0A1G7ZUU4_9SPHI|nr:hypothetical protein SAMN05421827_11727 [Pedobacter terrae]